MRLLLLGLMLMLGRTNAQTAWTTGAGGALARFVGTDANAQLQYVVGRQGGLEEPVLEFSTTATSAKLNGLPTSCTQWVNIGTLSGSVVIQTYSGGGGEDLNQLQLNSLFKGRTAASAVAFAAPLCDFGRLTPGRVLYVPLNTPIGIALGLTLTLKPNSKGRVVAAIK